MNQKQAEKRKIRNKEKQDKQNKLQDGDLNPN